MTPDEAVPAGDRLTWFMRPDAAARSTRSPNTCNPTSLRGEYLQGQDGIEVIDLLEDPARAEDFAAPLTSARRPPAPLRRNLGDRSEVDCVDVGLRLQAG